MDGYVKVEQCDFKRKGLVVRVRVLWCLVIMLVTGLGYGLLVAHWAWSQVSDVETQLVGEIAAEAQFKERIVNSLQDYRTELRGAIEQLRNDDRETRGEVSRARTEILEAVRNHHARPAIKTDAP